jgi:glycosyltransferase involved in cell wall biosynthesis
MIYWFSIIIIAKDEGHIIEKTLVACKHLSDDILVIINDSKDNTASICKSNGAKVIESDWLGYGATKNYGHQLAKHDWILSLDADEIVDNNLADALVKLTQPGSSSTCFCLNRLQVWDGQVLKFGKTREQKIRLFNKHIVEWDNSLVHESLIFTAKKSVVFVDGAILHYSYKNEADARNKMDKYAKLFAQDKKAKNIILKWVKCFWTGFQALIIHAGVLDGLAGWQFAKLKMYYTYKKYS